MRYRSAIVLACASMLIAGASAPASGQSPKKSVEIAERPSVHGFSVTLVLGDMQGASSADNMPPGAKKALADMRDFLPYKSYRLLDTQWILCCGSSKVGTGVSGRLRGISLVDSTMPMPVPVYSFAVTVLDAAGPQLSVRFLLTDGANPPVKKNSYPPGSPAEKELQRKVEELLYASGGAKGAVIDSTFSMNIGETVVIGTSSLKGDKALVALLTAARRPGSQSDTMEGERR